MKRYDILRDRLFYGLFTTKIQPKWCEIGLFEAKAIILSKSAVNEAPHWKGRWEANMPNLCSKDCWCKGSFIQAILNCGDKFCKSCILHWLKVRPTSKVVQEWLSNLQETCFGGKASRQKFRYQKEKSGHLEASSWCSRNFSHFQWGAWANIQRKQKPTVANFENFCPECRELFDRKL